MNNQNLNMKSDDHYIIPIIIIYTYILYSYVLYNVMIHEKSIKISRVSLFVINKIIIMYYFIELIYITVNLISKYNNKSKILNFNDNNFKLFSMIYVLLKIYELFKIFIYILQKDKIYVIKSIYNIILFLASWFFVFYRMQIYIYILIFDIFYQLCKYFSKYTDNLLE